MLDELEWVAADLGATMAQVALGWVAQRPAVASVLFGARTDAQLAESLGAAELRLSDEHVERLSVVSAPGIADYPYGMLAQWCGVTVWDELRTRPEPD